MGEKSVSVVLATYCEGENIEQLIRETLAVLSAGDEVLVVDDSSPDGTESKVKQIMHHDSRVRLIVRRNERGLTSAIQRGIDESKGDLVVWMDCDLSQSPSLIPKLKQRITQDGYDVAVGSRFVPGGKNLRFGASSFLLRFHAWLSVLLNLGASVLMCSTYRDWTSGYFMGTRQVLNRERLKGDYGEYFINLIFRLQRAGYRIAEVPYSLTLRQKGESKTSTTFFGFFRTGRKYLRTLLLTRMYGS